MIGFIRRVARAVIPLRVREFLYPWVQPIIRGRSDGRRRNESLPSFLPEEPFSSSIYQEFAAKNKNIIALLILQDRRISTLEAKISDIYSKNQQI